MSTLNVSLLSLMFFSYLFELSLLYERQQPEHPSEFVLVCFMEEGKAYEFETT